MSETKVSSKEVEPTEFDKRVAAVVKHCNGDKNEAASFIALSITPDLASHMIESLRNATDPQSLPPVTCLLPDSFGVVYMYGPKTTDDIRVFDGDERLDLLPYKVGGKTDIYIISIIVSPNGQTRKVTGGYEKSIRGGFKVEQSVTVGVFCQKEEVFAKLAAKICMNTNSRIQAQLSELRRAGFNDWDVKIMIRATNDTGNETESSLRNAIAVATLPVEYVEQFGGVNKGRGYREWVLTTANNVNQVSNWMDQLQHRTPSTFNPADLPKAVKKEIANLKISWNDKDGEERTYPVENYDEANDVNMEDTD